MLLLLYLLDLVERLLFLANALSFPLHRLDFESNVILLGDELLVLLTDLLHLLLIRLLFVFESLVV